MTLRARITSIPLMALLAVPLVGVGTASAAPIASDCETITYSGNSFNPTSVTIPCDNGSAQIKLKNRHAVSYTATGGITIDTVVVVNQGDTLEVRIWFATADEEVLLIRKLEQDPSTTRVL